MTTLNTSLNDLMGELLGVLDQEIYFANLSLQRLDELRRLLIKREENMLKELLEQIQADSGYSVMQNRRKEIIAKLAVLCCCKVENVNLTMLIAALPEKHAVPVSQKQAELKELMAKLKDEHFCTQALLKECWRFNRSIVQAIFGTGKESTTYDAMGRSRWQNDSAMVSVRL